MKKLISSVVVTANLVSLQALAQPSYGQLLPQPVSQEAQALSNLDSAGLIKTPEGTLEIPGIGGASTEASANGQLMIEAIEADQSSLTTETTNNTTTTESEGLYRIHQSTACHSPVFTLISVCWEF